MVLVVPKLSSEQIVTDQILRLEPPHHHQREDSVLPLHRFVVSHFAAPLQQVDETPHREEIVRRQQCKCSGDVISHYIGCSRCNPATLMGPVAQNAAMYTQHGSRVRIHARDEVFGRHSRHK